MDREKLSAIFPRYVGRDVIDPDTVMDFTPDPVISEMHNHAEAHGAGFRVVYPGLPKPAAEHRNRVVVEIGRRNWKCYVKGFYFG